MTPLNYNQALESLDLKLDEVYEKYGFDKKDMTRLEIMNERKDIDLSLDDKQTLKEHFRDIVYQVDATGEQSKTSLFYGGGDFEGKMGDQVKPLQDNYRNIVKTEVGKFMTDGQVTLTVEDFYKSVFGNNPSDAQVRQSMLNFKNEQWTHPLQPIMLRQRKDKHSLL